MLSRCDGPQPITEFGATGRRTFASKAPHCNVVVDRIRRGRGEPRETHPAPRSCHPCGAPKGLLWRRAAIPGRLDGQECPSYAGGAGLAVGPTVGRTSLPAVRCGLIMLGSEPAAVGPVLRNEPESAPEDRPGNRSHQGRQAAGPRARGSPGPHLRGVGWASRPTGTGVPVEATGPTDGTGRPAWRPAPLTAGREEARVGGSLTKGTWLWLAPERRGPRRTQEGSDSR